MFTKKTKLLLFPKPSLNHIFFLLYFFCSILKQAILKDFKEQSNLSIPVFKLYIYNIGDYLSFIPYIIIKKKSKSEADNNNDLTKEKSKDEINYIYNNKIKKEIKNNIKHIILNLTLISLFDFFAQISSVIYYLVKQKQNMEVKQANMNSLLIFNVIFLFLFSRLILKTKFYRHHFFSFIIFFICLIVINFLDFEEIYEGGKETLIISIIYLSVRIFGVILYSISDVLAKNMFLYYYFSPYFLLLIKAVIQFFYLIIFSLPLCFIKFKDENGQEMLLFSMFGGIFDNKIYILFYVLYLINSFFYNIFDYILVDKFSPNHSAIAKILENLGIFLINVIEGDITFGYYLIIRLIMYVILIIASLIFNEFLVINICGLGNYTKLFLDYREKFDLSLIEEISENEDNTIVGDNEYYHKTSTNDELNVEEDK